MKYGKKKIIEILDSGEPIFILRGKDLLTPDSIRDYSHRASLNGCSPEYCADVLKVADVISLFQNENQDICKLPD